MGFFITNTNKTLGETVNNLIPSCDYLFFLVGYFYFSGFQLLYKQITEDQELKILVGLEAESKINSYIEFSSSKGFTEQSNQSKRRTHWYKSIEKIIANSKDFDNQESLEAFRLFVKKIQNGTLEVRQTNTPCHAKMYIFQNDPDHNQNGEFLGTTVVGSSNLSANGFLNNFEINIQHKDNPFFEESKEIFNKLWSESSTLANKDTYEELNNNLLNKVWFDKNYPPFILYLKVLIEYFETHEIKEDIRTPSQILGEDFKDLKYQTDAIEQGINIIKEHSGVIIADVVGLGKSIIATTIADNLNLPVLVITPPQMIPQWEEYSAYLNRNSRVFSSGKIDEALEYANRIKRHYLVIIDEAHQYRNPKTQNFSRLETLCRGNKVIILSATPFNNEPEDIFSLIKLFQIPSCSTLKSVPNLAEAMRRIQSEYQSIKHEDPDRAQKCKKIAAKIRHLIHEVVIRRNRKDLMEREKYKEDLSDKIYFPQVEDPKLLEYSFGDFSAIYKQSLETLAGDKSSFKAARYRITSYIKDEYIKEINKYLGFTGGDPLKNNAKFIKSLLTRRLESSIYAFKKSLGRMIHFYEKSLNFLKEQHRFLVSKKITLDDLDGFTFEELEDEWNTDYTAAEQISNNSMFKQTYSHLNPEQENDLKSKGIYLIHADYLKEDFANDLANDLKILKQLEKDWEGLNNTNDPKLAYLKEILSKQLQEDSKRKIILFSQFADTINYLTENLPADNIIKPISYNAQEPKGKREIIRANFDASYPKEQQNAYNLLLTTDAMSEGVNLNRAGTVFNYDIPYNPTIVIQRVGRINRVNRKVFDKLFIYNFFPTEIGECETNIKKITEKKIGMIDSILGEDTRYLTPLEVTKGSLSHLPKNDDEEVSWETKYLNILDSIQKNNPELYKQAKNLPARVRIGRNSKDDKSGILIFGRRDDVGVFVFYDTNSQKAEYISDEDALKLFEASQEEKSIPTSKYFFTMYQNAQEEMEKRIKIGNENSRSAEAKAKTIIDKLKSMPCGNFNLYISKLGTALKNGALCKAKLNAIKDTYDNYKDDLSTIELLLKEEIPESYLKTVLETINQRESRKNINIILSTEFIGEEIKGELL